MFTHIYLFILNYMWFFSISISPGFPPALLLLSLNIHISLLSFLNKNTISGFLYVKTMTKWFYSQFWKWLNLTTIVFYDNLCFHVPGLLLYQHFFFFYPKYEHFPISAFAENKSLHQEYIFMEKSMFRSSHQT